MNQLCAVNTGCRNPYGMRGVTVKYFAAELAGCSQGTPSGQTNTENNQWTETLVNWFICKLVY
jgi:hypothetical protein